MIAAAARTSGTRSPLASTFIRGSTVSAISRAVAMARARASFALRVCDRSAEYARAGAFGAGRRVVTADFVEDFARGFAVAASTGARPILTRLASARGPIQKVGFLFTWTDPGLWLEEVGPTV